MTNKDYREWIKERDEAVATLNVETFAKFYAKWQEKGIYQLPFPNLKIAEIAMYKMAFNIPEMPTAIKVKALNWLKNRGYDTKL